eukprot:TRINITY_DN2846_c0_g1_i2.p1 TRINITY_DN2846_c0_g1~~TRINITY_DN2846_c0_g1_i2.p1  ORF type:complete len:108 (+),score=1.74 TRINITY_DN2846_c0_g1_i2:135-458(+)
MLRAATRQFTKTSTPGRLANRQQSRTGYFGQNKNQFKLGGRKKKGSVLKTIAATVVASVALVKAYHFLGLNHALSTSSQLMNPQVRNAITSVVQVLESIYRGSKTCM